MSRDITGRMRWQTLRAPVLASDTLLTVYKASDLTAAVKLKMTNIHPATAIMLRGFGTDADGEVATVTISGWMNHEGKQPDPGPGVRLWDGTCTFGSKALTERPTTDPNWPVASYFETDTWADAVGLDFIGTTIFNSTNRESLMIVPTLGFTYILAEVVLTTAATFGLLYYPIMFGEARLTL